MKKYVSIVLALIMVLALFTACGAAADEPENTGDGDQITLKLFHRYATDEQVAFMDKVIALFEEENPNINVEVSTSGRDEYRDKLKVVLGSNDIPDVFFSYAVLYRRFHDCRGCHAGSSGRGCSRSRRIISEKRTAFNDWDDSLVLSSR